VLDAPVEVGLVGLALLEAREAQAKVQGVLEQFRPGQHVGSQGGQVILQGHRRHLDDVLGEAHRQLALLVLQQRQSPSCGHACCHSLSFVHVMGRGRVCVCGKGRGGGEGVPVSKGHRC